MACQQQPDARGLGFQASMEADLARDKQFTACFLGCGQKFTGTTARHRDLGYNPPFLPHGLNLPNAEKLFQPHANLADRRPRRGTPVAARTQGPADSGTSGRMSSKPIP